MKRKKLNSLQWQYKLCHEKVLMKIFGSSRIFSAVDAFPDVNNMRVYVF